LSAADVIRLLQLTPHPEGGHYRETFRDAHAVQGRSASTAIYFLLARGERTHWHRIDAVEVWHYYAGAPLALAIAAVGLAGPAGPASFAGPAGATTVVRLGSDLAGGEQPQAMVPAGVWQAAESLGAWSLVGCTVAPGFAFAGLEFAPPGWSPIG